MGPDNKNNEGNGQTQSSTTDTPDVIPVHSNIGSINDSPSQTFPQTTNEPIEPPKTSNKPSFNWKLILIAVAIAIVIAGIAVGATYYVMNQQANNNKTITDKQIAVLQTQVAALKKTQTSTSATATTTDPTAGWKTYTNPSLGFSLRYPTDWTLINSQGGTPGGDFVSFVSPNIATETKGMIDAPHIDIGISSANKSSAIADDTTPGGVKALLLHQEGKDTSSYYSQQYSETINSLVVNEFNMMANPPFFDAVFPVGNNYIDMAFLTTQTKAGLDKTSSEILSSFKAN
jgi:hypothetical protein